MSKSTLNKKLKAKRKAKHKTVFLITKLISFGFIILIILTVLIFSNLISNSFKAAKDTSSFKDANVSNYFDQETIKVIRNVDKNKDDINLPNDRINPF